MQTYIIRRILLFIPTLFLVSIVVFVLLRIGPGDPVDIFLGDAAEGTRALVSQRELQELRASLHLDDNIVVQYGKWLVDVFTLNPGNSFRLNAPVIDQVKSALPLTIEIALVTMALAMLIAIPLGVISAIRQDTWIDYLLRIFSIGFLAMPIFWTGLIAILISLEFFNWIPPIEYKEIWEDPVENIKKLWLPILILAINSSAVIARMMRSGTLEILRQDYVRTAYAKGLSERLVLSRHVIKNAMLPVITVAGLQAAILFGGVLIMEQLFVLPGIGFKLVSSITTDDFPMIQFIVIMIAFFIMTINLLVDLTYGILDPRIRYQ